MFGRVNGLVPTLQAAHDETRRFPSAPVIFELCPNPPSRPKEGEELTDGGAIATMGGRGGFCPAAGQPFQERGTSLTEAKGSSSAERSRKNSAQDLWLVLRGFLSAEPHARYFSATAKARFLSVSRVVLRCCLPGRVAESGDPVPA